LENHPNFTFPMFVSKSVLWATSKITLTEFRSMFMSKTDFRRSENFQRSIFDTNICTNIENENASWALSGKGSRDEKKNVSTFQPVDGSSHRQVVISTLKKIQHPFTILYKHTHKLTFCPVAWVSTCSMSSCPGGDPHSHNPDAVLQ